MKDNNLKDQFVSGIAISFISKYMNIFVNIFITVILARLLGPEEFGIVSVVMVFTTFFQLISQLGIGPAIIQNKDLSNFDISSISKFTIVIAIFVSIGFYFFSYLIAKFYGNVVYIDVGKYLSISVLFNTLNTIPTAILSKEKKFKEIGINTVISSLLGGLIAIILAFKGMSYYSIVIKSIFVSFTLFLFNYKKSKVKLQKGFNLNSIKKIGSYSSYQFLFNFINYFSRNLDNILIGKYMGPSQLGYYDKAYQLMMYPVSNLTHVITPVLHPLLSDYKDNKNKIYVVYKTLTKFLLIIGVPVCIMLFFYAKEIILIMYGSNWLEIVPTFKILAVSIIMQIVLSSSGSIFQAAGKTNFLFLSGFLSAITMITGISIGVYLDKLEYVAMGILFAMIFNFFQGYYILIVKVLNEKLFDFLINFRSPIIIAFIMIATNIIVSSFIVIDVLLVNFIFGAILNFTIWIGCIFLLKENGFMQLDNIIHRFRHSKI